MNILRTFLNLVMDYVDLNPKAGNKPAAAGALLIAEPLLADPNFSRSVVLLCEHSTDGTVGFVLNQETALTLTDIVEELENTDLPIYQGGPVQPDTMHVLHRIPALLGGTEVAPGIYWGGTYDSLKTLVTLNTFNPADIRLFIGYSGWSPGQLDAEIGEGSWLVTGITTDLLFDTPPADIWKKAIGFLDKKYAFLANVPANPQLN